MFCLLRFFRRPGSTGTPKGLLHSTAGYLLYTSLTHKYVFDLKEDDVYACLADVGWITGHSYIVYGPLANGATTLMFESLPTYPNPSRYWLGLCRLSQLTVPEQGIGAEAQSHFILYSTNCHTQPYGIRRRARSEVQPF